VNEAEAAIGVLTRYFTDGVHLYEVVNDRVVENYGLAGGQIRTVILRDTVSEATGVLGDLELATLTQVLPHAA
jgi:hypothetical protein